MSSPPFSAGDAGSVPGPGRCLRETEPLCHYDWACALELRNHNYWAHVLPFPKLLSPTVCAPREEKPPQREAHTLLLKCSPHSPQPAGSLHSNGVPAQAKQTDEQVSLQEPLKCILDIYIKQLKKKQEEVGNKVKNDNNKQDPVLFKPSLFKDQLCRSHVLWRDYNDKALWGKKGKKKTVKVLIVPDTLQSPFHSHHLNESSKQVWK